MTAAPPFPPSPAPGAAPPSAAPGALPGSAAPGPVPGSAEVPRQRTAPPVDAQSDEAADAPSAPAVPPAPDAARAADHTAAGVPFDPAAVAQAAPALPPTGARAPRSALATALAAQLHRWSLAAGAPPVAAAVAAQAGSHLAEALADGHVCLLLHELPPLPAAAWPDRDPATACAAAAASATPSATPTAAAPVTPSAGASAGASAAAWRQQLLASRIAADPEQARAATLPLVLDAEQRLFLHRQYDEELRLARRLHRATSAPAEPVSAPALALLRQLFAPSHAPDQTNAQRPAVCDWQQLAAALALRQRLLVISGGPGTGKTSTVAKLLACLLAQQPGLRIALAAPTGKAAARMAEALRQRADSLPAAIRQALPAEASTVHRLLGVNPAASGGYTYHARHRLPLDLLVVDEASMLDLALATALFEALPDAARLVLLGDKDQLAAVDSGAVFAQLSARPTLRPATCRTLEALCQLPEGSVVPPEAVPPADACAAAQSASALPDSVVWLTRSYRFAHDGGIGRAAAAIRDAQADALVQLLRPHRRPAGSPGSEHQAQQAARANADADADADANTNTDTEPDALYWLDEEAAANADAVRRWIAEGYAPLLAMSRQAQPDPAALLAQFERHRVLCAQHAGPRGTDAVNRWMTELAMASATGPHSGPWYTGRPVMVLRNDPTLRLFNGDTGICAPDEQGRLRVWFAGTDADTRLAARAGDGSATVEISSQLPQEAMATNAPAARDAPAAPRPAAPRTRLRAVAPMRLPEHHSAYATTVHKSQGSEFDRVSLLLPTQPGRLLSRELLYTGVTRARKTLVLIAPESVLRAAVAQPTLRRSGLASRLHEVAGESEAPSPKC